MWRWTLLAITACSGAPSSDAGTPIDAPSGARVELGTGVSRFVPFADGDELELVAGAQGGWHVDLTARIWDVEIDGAFLEYEASPVGATSPLSLPTEIELTPARVVREGDHWLRAGDFLQLDITGPDDVVGRRLEIRVEVRDRNGASARDARVATIVDRE